MRLSRRDVDATLLKHYGVKAEEPSEPQLLEPRVCPRCKFHNPAFARFCAQCSAALDVRVAIALEEARQSADDIVARVMREFIRRAPELVRDILKQTDIAAEIEEFRRAQLASAEGGVS